MIPIMVETVEKFAAIPHCQVSAGYDRRDQQR
jgi:hypothetical protein